MAKGNAAWGIDIGQTALKALRCRPHEKEPRRLVVEAFDYIEYPKILTQPESDPPQLIRDALQEFLSRNDLSGDTVGISVSGQSGLARFIKLPPVESKKIPDIVKYEARQQIPFSLDDVVWDYQQLTGGSEEDGFALEPEVGLFAMKRDQVARALAPLEEAGIEVDLIQLAPLTIYNYVCFDRLEELKSQAYDPANPPPSTVVISIGTDTTDLVVTNGFRVWQRSIPIGGNHFTRALSKELKLTFVKAEHLKRNAMQADDPKAVFQAMRPVFSDLLAEIQRSLGYFMSLDKSAHIGEVIALGNAMKLPGLQRYLAQNLDQDVRPIEGFERLHAGSASASAQFKENVLSFAPAYGLCVQALGKGELRTNLLPEEIVTRRLVRSKKPWAVAGIAALLSGIAFNYFTHVSAWHDTQTDEMQRAVQRADSVKTMATSLETQRTEINAAAKTLIDTQTRLISNVEGRLRWLELTKALASALPRDERKREQTKEHIESRTELHIKSLDSQQYADIQSEYIALIEDAYWASKGGRPGAEGDAEGADGMATEMPMDTLPVDEGAATTEVVASEGASTTAGWVIQLTGFHFHNADRSNQTRRFVTRTLLDNLENGKVELPDGPNGAMVEVPIKDLGISHVWLAAEKKLTPHVIDPDAELVAQGGSLKQPTLFPGEGTEAAQQAPEAGIPTEPPSKAFEVQKYDFVVQFCWQPTTRAQRRALAAARAEQEQAAEEAAAAAAAAGEAVDGAVVDGAGVGDETAGEGAAIDDQAAVDVAGDAAPEEASPDAEGGDTDPAADAQPPQ